MWKVYPIPALESNYFWLIQPDTRHRSTYIIDPGAAEPIERALAHYQLQPEAILVTHHHKDHIGGVAELVQKLQIPVYGPDSPKIPQVTHIVREADNISLGPLQAKVLAIPGHTLDHIAYYFDDIEGVPRLFSGDTLFGAGCGRLFDGSADQLYASLQRIANLPDNTLVYAAHEYTLANIQFALHIEPGNADLIAREQKERERRQNNIPTMPTQLSIEKRTNPFLRCHLPQIRIRMEELSGKTSQSPGDIFANLRRAKDQF